MSPDCSKLIFLDLETGGLDPRRHPIIQLAAIAVDGESLRALETIELKVQFDERRANKYAIRKNSYSRAVWQAHALPEEEAANRFGAFLRRHATYPTVSRSGETYHLAQLVAHNASFDVDFLHTWYEKLKLFCPARHQAFCTLQRSLWHFFENPPRSSLTNFKLESLCQHLGVPFSAADAHDALGDVRATVELYRALVARLPAVPYPNAA
jgi:DNA polymerase-3 subunit epsilon/ribonuclease T